MRAEGGMTPLEDVIAALENEKCGWRMGVGGLVGECPAKHEGREGWFGLRVTEDAAGKLTPRCDHPGCESAVLVHLLHLETPAANDDGPAVIVIDDIDTTPMAGEGDDASYHWTSSEPGAALDVACEEANTHAEPCVGGCGRLQSFMQDDGRWLCFSCYARVTHGRRPRGAESDEQPQRFRAWTIKELLTADLTYQWDAIGFLIRPTYGVDTGELKTLKSYFGMARMIGLAAGVPILGRWPVPKRLRVLAYVAEGGRIPWTRRFIRMCEAHGVDPADLDGWLKVVYEAGPLDSTDFRDTFTGHLGDFAPAFTQLDPLYPFQPMTVDSNKLAQVGRMLNEVQAICARYESTFWITPHMNQTGTGFDLKRIAGAGVGEWGDSWVLLRHRLTPDVAAGRFRLTADIGSRQWGGGTFEVDFNIGKFDPETGSHDGPIRFKVVPAGTEDEPTDKDAAKRVTARSAVLKTMRSARTALTRDAIAERTTGVTKIYIRAEIAVMIEQGLLVEHGIRKPEKGAHNDVPLYRLADEWRDA
jgi:hypothetical protein